MSLKDIPVLQNSFSVDYHCRVFELRSPIGVDLPVNQNMETITGPEQKFTAIWDTGATGCSITKHVADSIGVAPIGLVRVGGVHDIQQVNAYLVSLYLPNRFCFAEVQVTDLGDCAGCDVLIGMDIIGKGDFTVNSLGGKTSFTFRIPSLYKNNYAKFRLKDNMPCPCGSGNMYKNCCKKYIIYP